MANIQNLIGVSDLLTDAAFSLREIGRKSNAVEGILILNLIGETVEINRKVKDLINAIMVTEKESNDL